jgi:glycosyltransferase involved in cell wall biosynthesis
VPVALVTTFLSDYRLPLYRLLAHRYGVEVLCYGRGERYAPPWFSDLDAQLAEADFPARRLEGIQEAFGLGRRYDAVIAPFAGGSMLPAAYVGAKRFGTPFVLWASVWHQPRSLVHALSLPVTRHIYRHADAVATYGEHVRRFVASIRGRDDDVFVAPQAVEEQFGRDVSDAEVREFRERHVLGDGPLVLYVGRVTETKGTDVLFEAAPLVRDGATVVVVGNIPPTSPDADVRSLGPLPRSELPVAYAAAALTAVPSIPTPRFKEPWGLVCNEAMSQGRPVVATSTVGAVAGGLVRDGQTGLVVPPGDPQALAAAINRLLDDAELRERLGAAARQAVAPYTYEAMADGIGRALAAAGVH